MYYQNLIIIHECSKQLLKMKTSKSFLIPSTFHVLRAKSDLFQSVHFGFIAPTPPQLETVYARYITEIDFEHSGKKQHPDNSGGELS